MSLDWRLSSGFKWLYVLVGTDSFAEIEVLAMESANQNVPIVSGGFSQQCCPPPGQHKCHCRRSISASQVLKTRSQVPAGYLKKFQTNTALAISKTRTGKRFPASMS